MSHSANLRLRQGTTWRLHLTWRDPDGTPRDLTGSTAELRTATPPGITLAGAITPLEGSIVFELTDEETTALTPKERAPFVVDVTDSIGDVVELLDGMFTVRRDPTR